MCLFVLSLHATSSHVQRRGQAPMITKNSSVRYAEAVAMRKVKDQPEKESGLTSEDVAMAAF